MIGSTRELKRNDWTIFFSILNESRIVEAEKSLKEMLETENFGNKRFLDIASGSGLFSLADRRLGAKVYSFDYDPLSVACGLELKSRYFPSDTNWTIEQGDVLDAGYLHSFGQFDVVYSWGVLHHAGDMWQALEIVVPLIAYGGKLAVSVYNDQDRVSLRWAALKKFYNQSSRPVRMSIVLAVGVFRFFSLAFNRLIKFQNPLSFRDWIEGKKDRGMSVWHDLVDWVGGYPFEVAKSETIFDFYREKGFYLAKLKTSWGGCNEFVFTKEGKRKT